MNLSVSNRLLNRQPATNYRLPIRWTCLFQIGNWIGNRQIVTACRFVELISVFNRQLNRQPTTTCGLAIRWTCLFRIGHWIGNRQLVAGCRFVELILAVLNLNRFVEFVCFDSATESATGNQLPVAESLNMSVSNRQLNWQPATSCRLPIRWTYIVRVECKSATGNRLLIRWTCLFRNGNRIDSLNLSVFNRQLNRQSITSCRLPIRWTYIVRFESESATGNYLRVADSLNMSVSNRQLKRQPATSCRLPSRWTYITSFESESIRWTCLFRIGNWIGNRQLVAGCRFVELKVSVSNLNRQPATGCRFVELVCFKTATESIRWTCLFRIGNWIGNQQLVAGCRFFELILSVSNQNRQPATSFRLLIRWTCLFRIGNWIGNRKIIAGCRLVELTLSISNLNRFVDLVCFESATESATDNSLSVANSLNLYYLFRIGKWIGNRQLNRQLATWARI